MKVSVNWLKDFVDLSGVDLKNLWYKFTMSTAEIGELIETGRDIQNVVVAKVLKVKPHPASGKLKIVELDTGTEIIQSPCGASNIGEGINVAFAKSGGSIKNVSEVKKVTIEGFESNGIICSAAALGISDNHEGVLVLSSEYKPGTNIKDLIEIDDIIINIDNKSLSNRPDLWGHYGIAREIAAILRRKLKPLDLAELKDDPRLQRIYVKVEDLVKCPRYSCLIIENIMVKQTPFNMQVRLNYCGIRPISPIEDLTNYLMLEIGQPVHAFDKRFLEKIVIKTFETETKFVTLDGMERTLPPDTLMICNLEKPVAIAGIMGGKNSQVLDDTTAIVLEAANFEGASIRESEVKIGLRTEASARFETMLDLNYTVISIKRFFKLLQTMQPDIKMGSHLTDVYAKPPEPNPIVIDKTYIDKYFGNVLDSGLIEDILKSLEFDVKREGDVFTVKVPSFRTSRYNMEKVDLVKEINRIYGNYNIE